MSGVFGSKQLYWFILRNIVCTIILVLPGVNMESQTQAGNKQESQPQANQTSDTKAGVQKQAEASDLETPQRQVPDPGVITTNQTISPAGVQSVFESRVYAVTFGASSREVYAATNSKRGTLVYRLDWQSNKVLEKLVHNSSSPGLQGLTYAPASQSVLMTAIDEAGVELVSKWNGATQPGPTFLGKNEIAEVAVSPSGASGTRYAVVALTFDDRAAILNLSTGTTLAKVKTGIAPFGVVIDARNTTAYVSNWGGRVPRLDDLTATTGPEPDADKIVVDSRGVAASGTVSRIDLKSGDVTAEIEVGLHPTSLALDDSRNRLYVANSNSDTISVIDTKQNAVVETISIEPFTHAVAGISPESLALSKDGQHLYVACAGINAVAVLALKGRYISLEGLIPTGWYPDSIALSPDGQFLGVATLLGVGSGWKNAPSSGIEEGFDSGCPGGQLSPACRYVHSYRGTIHVIAIPDPSQLRRYSIAVAEDNHLRLRSAAEPKEAGTAPVKEMPVPLRAGDPSPIKHIIYIIKENRSYDQYFGGLGKGNGDPSLEEYSDDVIPNQRKLAREFVLLDNFYATGGNSGDGHQWVTQANETDYAYLPGYDGRSYALFGDDPMVYSRGGFIWNAAADAGRSFVDFGEYGGEFLRVERTSNEHRKELWEDFRNGSTFEGRITHEKSPIASLNPYLVKDYPGWNWEVPDVVRARIFMRYLKQWEAQNDMPNLVMAQLHWDHTAGTMPGFPTPKASIADNDYALGMIVDSVSHSKFWGSTLILVVEDDAQSGVDHVDGHRTVAQAISPYIKRGSVDSTFYSQPSMLKTIELILGLKNLSLFDLIANDMRNSFQNKPDLTPYTAQEPTYSIYAVNPALRALTGQKRIDAEASLKMNFSIPDAAPTEKLNRILWRDARGTKAPYPKVTQAVFATFSNDLDDDEKEKLSKRR
jgi:YVTN family beta-propeller protein